MFRMDMRNGKAYKYNKRYAYDRDDYVMKPAVELVLKYRCLEYILGESTMKNGKRMYCKKIIGAWKGAGK